MLSIIILTKNSEETITACLESLRGLGDEVVIVDSQSTDRTVQIAEKFGAKVTQHEFKDFSDQRNFALQQVTGEWVLYIDSDEEATEEFKEEVRKVIGNYKTDSGIGGYFTRRKTFYFGKDWDLVDRVQRLFYKPYFIEWQGEVHETPKIKGSFGMIDAPIIHNTHRSLSQMVQKTNKWSEYEAELRFKSDHPQMTWWRFLRVMLTGFFRSYFFEKGYKNETAGVVEEIFQAFSMFVTYAKLWEKQISSLHRD